MGLLVLERVLLDAGVFANIGEAILAHSFITSPSWSVSTTSSAPRAEVAPIPIDSGIGC
jgi:hypothetical protein